MDLTVLYHKQSIFSQCVYLKCLSQHVQNTFITYSHIRRLQKKQILFKSFVICVTLHACLAVQSFLSHLTWRAAEMNRTIMLLQFSELLVAHPTMHQISAPPLLFMFNSNCSLKRVKKVYSADKTNMTNICFCRADKY